MVGLSPAVDVPTALGTRNANWFTVDAARCPTLLVIDGAAVITQHVASVELQSAPENANMYGHKTPAAGSTKTKKPDVQFKEICAEQSW